MKILVEYTVLNDQRMRRIPTPGGVKVLSETNKKPEHPADFPQQLVQYLVAEGSDAGRTICMLLGLDPAIMFSLEGRHVAGRRLRNRSQHPKAYTRAGGQTLSVPRAIRAGRTSGQHEPARRARRLLGSHSGVCHTSPA